jgi:hypothetical protein
LENGAFSGINDFVISFEPPCYFSKLVGRVSKLFISRAWIDHIPWGHGNTLVGGILVCINLHTFFITKYRPKMTIWANKCQENACFYICDVQVRILRKSCKNGHESMKRSQKPMPGSIFQDRINCWAQSAKSILEDLSVVIFSP